ncbi:putative membrane protein [Halarsenatibacter silvermanii]|uniref:Putative membrane protein n=2 Tax=Halarsenatibacter silvermanii TaxID=321763 RepID=A0A1G9TJT9_9FIRM|nr:putative membrane protein [Halarsenatibacter silvermanii]
MVLIWIIIIIGAIWLIKEMISSGSNNSNSDDYKDDYKVEADEEKDTPAEIARKRLARGEISREEFEEIMQSLNNSG